MRSRLALAAVVAVAMTGCGDDALSGDDARRVLAAYADALRHGNGAAACRLLTVSERREVVQNARRAVEGGGADTVTCAGAVAAAAKFYAGLRPRVERVRARVRVRGATATGRVRWVDRRGRARLHTDFRLIGEDGAWRVDHQVG